MEYTVREAKQPKETALLQSKNSNKVNKVIKVIILTNDKFVSNDKLLNCSVFRKEKEQTVNLLSKQHGIGSSDTYNICGTYNSI